MLWFGKRIGGISIKRTFLAIIALLAIILSVGCGSSGIREQETTIISSELSGSTSGIVPETNASTTDTETISSAQAETKTESTGNATGEIPGEGEQLLQSASVDLNGDGESEQVEAIQVPSGESGAAADEIEGILRIKSGTGDVRVSFWKKTAGMSGVLSSIKFEDLDGDGAKDVFVTIPDNGAAFAYSNYFIYSYKKNLSYSFTSDSELVDFIDGFQFKYNSGNKLTLFNGKDSFSADLTIDSTANQQPTGEDMGEYERKAWIDPVSVDISENSKLTLAKGEDGKPEIKVPLPIFGLATVDMIGEIDMYFIIDDSFHPVLKRYDVLDFNGNAIAKAGSCKITH